MKEKEKEREKRKVKGCLISSYYSCLITSSNNRIKDPKQLHQLGKAQGQG